MRRKHTYRVRLSWRGGRSLVDGARIRQRPTLHAIEELETAHLKHMCALLGDPAPRLREIGKRVLRDTAARLARECVYVLAEKRRTTAAAEERRRIGSRTARLVKAKYAAGKRGKELGVDPSTARRILKPPKRRK